MEEPRDSLDDASTIVPSLGGDTISSELYGDIEGDFARLRPANLEAQLAFSNVYEDLNSDPTANEHLLQFMRVKSSAGHVSATGSGDTNSSSRCSWMGYYRLNMEIAPAHMRLGWVMGCGVDKLPNNGVDFLLTKQKQIDRVHSRHARISHNQAGILLLRATRSVLVDGKEKIEQSIRSLWSRTTGLLIGNLAYVLEFTDLEHRVYRQQLSDQREYRGSSKDPPSTLPLTPGPTHFLYGDYIYGSPFSHGATCTVIAAVHKDGRAVAIKKMKRTAANAGLIRREIEIMKELGPHERISSLIDELYNDEADWRLRPGRVDEVHLVYEPLAETRLSQIVHSDMEGLDRLRIIRQCLHGIMFVHMKGFMHRDIKPDNLAIVSKSPPRAMLIDFGLATRSVTSSTFCGTELYAAPEVKAFRANPRSRPYDRSVDLWSMGVTSLEFLRRGLSICVLGSIDRFMSSEISNLVFEGHVVAADLVTKLMTRNPQIRIEAHKAMEHPCFDQASKLDFPPIGVSGSGSKRKVN